MSTRTVCLDFDGVFNDYDGWRGDDELFKPRAGLREFLDELDEEGYDIIIHTTRPEEKVIAWLEEWVLPLLPVSNSKPPAIAYIDDRAITFKGDYDDALEALVGFKTYWEKD